MQNNWQRDRAVEQLLVTALSVVAAAAGVGMVAAVVVRFLAPVLRVLGTP